MRLYFEAPNGARLAIDTDTRTYCRGADIQKEHRFIWLDGPKDLEIIELELDFNAWGYDGSFTADVAPVPDLEVYKDPFQRPPRTSPEALAAVLAEELPFN